MKLAFFDTKSYDIPGFDRYGRPAGVEIKYFEPNLNRDTVTLAAGFDAVCVFVNDTVDAVVVDKLHQLGVKAIVLMVSGATGKEVDLTGARITGYDPDRTGEQTVTFRITVDGKSVTGELKVTVKEEKKGCGSSVDYGAFLLIAFLPLAVIAVKKKGENYAD